MNYRCRSCSNEVSGNTIRCPHCGDPDAVYNKEIEPNERIIKAIERTIFVAAIIISLMFIFFCMHLVGRVTDFDTGIMLILRFLFLALGLAICLGVNRLLLSILEKSSYHDKLMSPYWKQIRLLVRDAK